MVELDKNIDDLKVLISQTEIQNRTKELANETDKHFPNDEVIYFVCVLKGSVMFFSELVKNINHNIKMEFIKVSSYGNETTTSMCHKTEEITLSDLNDKNVVIVEDIVDSGLTCEFLINMLKSKYKIKKLMFVSLLNKKCARKTDIEPDLFGFEVDDKFVVGFGLDYKGFFRNLPYIGYF